MTSRRNALTGTTKVARWRARWGTRPGALTGSIEAARTGFETALTVAVGGW